MPTTDQGQLVEVSIGSCRCPGGSRPHPDGDVVYMIPRADLAMGLAGGSALRQSGGYSGDANAALASVYVRYGVRAWNIVNEQGPVPVTPDAVLERLGWLEGGAIVAAKGVDLYQNDVLAPFQPTKSGPPRPSRNGGSTSPNRASRRRTRTSSPPSSPSQAEAGT